MTRIIAVLFSLLLTIAVLAGPAPAGLSTTIDTRIKDPALSEARIGVFIQSLEDGTIWYTREADTPFIPASVTKLVTGMLALEYLKPEYRFATRLYTDGERKDGVLTGNLYLQGGGDPSLSTDDLRAMVRELIAGDEEHGIPPLQEIRGKFILDESFFPRPGPLLGAGWEADDLPWYYAAPSGALTVNRNAVALAVHGTEAGKHTAVEISPATGLFTFQNRSTTSDRVTTGAIDLSFSRDTVRISGRVAPGATLTERISVPKPALYAAEQFRAALTEAGVTLGETTTGTVDPVRHAMMVEHESAPLSELIVTMLKNSDNLYAEQLRWTLLSLYSTEKPLDIRYAAMLKDFLTHSGLLDWGITLVDGSGLSRQNRITPASLTRLLAVAAAQPSFPAFHEALPIAGTDGTMMKRLCDSPACGNARVKTGTMRGVSSLAGYVTTADGERLAFAIMLNGYRNSSAAARKLQDDLVTLLAAQGTPVGPAVP